MLLTTNYLALANPKRLTGRVEAPSQEAACATVAAQLGADLTPPKLVGGGESVDLDFAGAPVADLLRILGDIGRVNVVAPGTLPDVDIHFHHVGWIAALATLAEVANRTVIVTGTTRYVVPAGTSLPSLRKLAADPVISIDINGGTEAQAIAAIAKVASVDVDACSSAPFRLRLRRVKLSEALRALELVGGTPLVAGTCPSVELAAHKLEDLHLVAIASAGAKRSAAFDLKGEIVVATTGGRVLEINDAFVRFTTATTELSPLLDVPMPLPDDHRLAHATRASAIYSIGKVWFAFVESPTWTETVRSDRPLPGELSDAAKIDPTGVHIVIDPQTTTTIPLGK